MAPQEWKDFIVPFEIVQCC